MIVPPTQNDLIHDTTDNSTPTNEMATSVSPSSTTTKPMTFDINNVHTGSSESTNSEYAKYPEVVAYLASGESNNILKIFKSYAHVHRLML